MIEHLKKNLGWYIMVPSLYLALAGESEIWLVIIVVLLKMPPFDLVGRYEAYLYKKMRIEEKGLKLKKKMSTKPKWMRFLFAMFVLLLMVLWMLYAPECELC
jgi:bacteriorhodopsin